MARILTLTTQVATFELENPILLGGRHGFRFYDNVIIRVAVEGGVTGSGYVWLGSPRAARRPDLDSAAFLVEATVRHIAPSVIGQDVFAYQRMWHTLTEGFPQLGSGLVSLAHSGVDMAAWDAICRVTEQPLHRLLGAAREAAPVYSTELMEVWNGTPEDHAVKARELVDRGITAVKMLYGTAAEEVDLERVAAVREAIGPDIGLMVDCASRFSSYEQALRACRRLEPFGLAWIEDPLPLSNPSHLVRLCAELETPVATGERSFSLAQLQALAEAKAADVILFDPMRIGGVTGVLRLAGITETFGVPIAPHAFSDLGVSLVAGLPNALIMEYLPWWGCLMKEPFEPTADGVGVPPSRPGTGIEFDDDALERLRVYPCTGAASSPPPAGTVA